MNRDRWVVVWAATVVGVSLAHAAIGLWAHWVLTHQSPAFGQLSFELDEHSPFWPHLQVWQLDLGRALGLVGACVVPAVLVDGVRPRERSLVYGVGALALCAVTVAFVGPLGLWEMFNDLHLGFVEPGKATASREALNLSVVATDLLIATGASWLGVRIRGAEAAQRSTSSV